MPNYKHISLYTCMWLIIKNWDMYTHKKLLVQGTDWLCTFTYLHLRVCLPFHDVPDTTYTVYIHVQRVWLMLSVRMRLPKGRSSGRYRRLQSKCTSGSLHAVAVITRADKAIIGPFYHTPSFFSRTLGTSKPCVELLCTMESFSVSLEGGAPWGFSIQGGLDHRSPLRVGKVSCYL